MVADFTPKLVEITSLYYITGNEGTPVAISDVNTVYDAAVVEVSNQQSGSILVQAEINGIGVSGTANYSGTVTLQTNSVIVKAYSTVGGTVTELPTGTLTENIKILVTGH